MEIDELKNKYFLIRHGHSEANEQGLIISNPKIGIENYGLTDKGRAQVEKSASFLNLETSKTIIISSDFKRTVETAKIVQSSLSLREFIVSEKLRERFFGDFDGKSHDLYKEVWIDDENNNDNSSNNVESPGKVAKRTEQLILELEKKYESYNIILVSHGDCLQILQTVFLQEEPFKHRSLPHLNTAEIREM